VCAAEIVGKGV